MTINRVDLEYRKYIRFIDISKKLRITQKKVAYANKGFADYY